jgi:type II secretory pathway component GspD/PulD (secretin)
MPVVSKEKFIVIILIILSVLLSLAGYIIRPVLGAESKADEIVFSLDVKDKPLGGVLRSIYEQTGFNFLVTDTAKNLTVTISLSKVPLEEGLNRVIKSTGISSHAVVFDNRKNVSIIIIDGSKVAMSSPERSFSAGGNLIARAEIPRTVPDHNTIATPPPPEIFSSHTRQEKSQQETSLAPPKDVYDMRYTRR